MKQNIFMVDDDLEDILFVKTAFIDINMDVKFDYLVNSENVVGYLASKGKKPDLILLDLNMPVKDGKTILQELKANPKLQTIPVVIFTTSHSEEERKEYLRLHAAAYVTKPDSYKDWAPVLKSNCKIYLMDCA